MSVRITSDLRYLNSWIIPERYNQPTYEEVMRKCVGMQYAMVIDIKSAFHHLELAEDSKHLTTMFTLKGLLCYNRLPQGLASSPSVWMKFMDRILGDMEGVGWWMDDIFTVGKTVEEHSERVKEVFRRLNKNNCRIAAPKLRLGVQKFQFAG